MSEGLIVCKFGGTSLADAPRVLKVAEIVQSDPRRRYVVVSAPGKRTPDDRKITDLLFNLQRRPHPTDGDDAAELKELRSRFSTMTREFGYGMTWTTEFECMLRELDFRAGQYQSPDYYASLGEYLMARILAQVLGNDGFKFVDAAELIFFGADGRLKEADTHSAIAARLKDVPRAVIPGFYGRGEDGTIRTFPRGGSDITGAHIAAATKAACYENWTDQPGVLRANPNVVENPPTIAALTYREMRELAYGGAEVFHPGAIPPVSRANIPVNIRCTNQPDAPGTWVVPDDGAAGAQIPVTGIAGRTGFLLVELEKVSMNEEVGFLVKAAAVFANHGVNIEHAPTSIDSLGVVVEEAEFNRQRGAIESELQQACRPDRIIVHPNLALVAVVGRRMRGTVGILATLASALAQAKINIRLVDQQISERCVIFGVNRDDYEPAVRALYQRCFGEPLA